MHEYVTYKRTDIIISSFNQALTDFPSRTAGGVSGWRFVRTSSLCPFLTPNT